jgi:serine/threonine-protein kinase
LARAKFRKFNLTKDRRWMEEASQSYRRALEVQKSDRLASVHFGLGMIHLGAGRYQEAASAFQRALELVPSDLDVARGLASAYEALGNLAEAEAAYRKTAGVKPYCFVGHSWLGLFYRKYGRYKEAEVEFQEAVRLAPDSPLAVTNLGALCLTTGRYGEAASFLKRSIAIKPTNSAYSNLGTAYYHLGCYADAAHMMEKAINLGMNNYRVWGNLAETYLLVPELRDRASGAFRHAIELAEQELTRSPANAELLGMLADYSARLGRRSEALAHIKKGLSLAPKNVNVLFRVALAYEVLGDRASALKLLEEAVKRGLPPAGEMRQAQALDNLRNDPAYRKLDPGYTPVVRRGCQQIN